MGGAENLCKMFVIFSLQPVPPFSSSGTSWNFAYGVSGKCGNCRKERTRHMNKLCACPCTKGTRVFFRESILSGTLKGDIAQVTQEIRMLSFVTHLGLRNDIRTEGDSDR